MTHRTQHRHSSPSTDYRIIPSRATRDTQKCNTFHRNVVSNSFPLLQRMKIMGKMIYGTTYPLLVRYQKLYSVDRVDKPHCLPSSGGGLLISNVLIIPPLPSLAYPSFYTSFLISQQEGITGRCPFYFFFFVLQLSS